MTQNDRIQQLIEDIFKDIDALAIFFDREDEKRRLINIATRLMGILATKE